jgi:hypothetical protein
MSRNGMSPVGLDKLEAALDTYGADRTRWPAPLRLALSGFIAGNPDAQRMMKDAESFDRLLDRAPEYDAARLAKLSARIAAAAEGHPRVASSQPLTMARSLWSGVRRHHGFAATALAASLVLGVFAGQTSIFNSAADDLLGRSVTGASKMSRQMAQTDDADSLLDEDLL